MKFSSTNFLFDLDGTVYRGAQAIPGAAEFIASLERNGRSFRFVTNRSNRSPQTVADHLRSLGIPCAAEHVITSAAAASHFVGRKSAFCIGEEGLLAPLRSAGATLWNDVTPGSADLAANFERHAPDFVVVGFDRDFSFAKLERAARLIRAGATLVSTNPDPFINSDSGIVPENGALTAAVEAASGVRAIVLGKPEPFLVTYAIEQMGAQAETSVVIGDNPDTDIACANRAGVESVLLLTGVTTENHLSSLSHQPTAIARDYFELKELFYLS